MIHLIHQGWHLIRVVALKAVQRTDCQVVLMRSGVVQEERRLASLCGFNLPRRWLGGSMAAAVTWVLCKVVNMGLAGLDSDFKVLQDQS